MNFSQLLETQSQLNQLLGTDPSAISDDALLTALFVECGELLQLLKPQWAWWKRHGQDFSEGDRAAQIDELADILHFLLIAVLKDGEEDEECAEHWESDSTVWSTERGGHSAHFAIKRVYVCADKYYTDWDGDELGWAFDWLAYATIKLGFTRDELEQAYLAKVDVNKARFTVPASET